jgi:hypothetical protein
VNSAQDVRGQRQRHLHEAAKDLIH